MARMIWKGNISFGLVSIPVALLPAEQREDLDFTLLDDRDLSPIGYRKVNKGTGREVPAGHITRGYEYAKGRYVVVDDADLKRASPERTQTIDILSIADPSEIDLRFYDRPYYLEPIARSDKAYALLRDALARRHKVAIASVVIRTRQHLAVLYPLGDILVLNVLRYASELRDPRKVAAPAGGKGHAASARELQMAEALIDDMVEPWSPGKYRDEYEDELLAFIRRRARKGAGRAEEPAEEAPPKKAKGEVIDMMELLKRSLKKKGGKRPPARAPKRRTA